MLITLPLFFHPTHLWFLMLSSVRCSKKNRKNLKSWALRKEIDPSNWSAAGLNISGWEASAMCISKRIYHASCA